MQFIINFPSPRESVSITVLPLWNVPSSQASKMRQAANINTLLSRRFPQGKVDLCS